MVSTKTLEQLRCHGKLFGSRNLKLILLLNHNKQQDNTTLLRVTRAPSLVLPHPVPCDADVVTCWKSCRNCGMHLWCHNS